MLASFTKGYPRLTNHLVMGAITVVGCVIAIMMATPSQSVLEMLSIGTGYIGLVLIAATLLIGPLNMLKVRKNPVNLNLRRDAGIWAGITSLAHVVLAFAVELNWGGTLLGFFLYKDGSLKLNLFGISNIIGLVAALVIIFLLVLSNNYFLKRLKGKRWKAMQRFNYLLFAVAFLHTFTQQVNNLRGIALIGVVLGGVALVMAGQLIGFAVYRQRANSRKVSEPVMRPVPTQTVRPVNPYVSLPSQQRPQPMPAAQVLSQNSADYSNRQMAAAFSITAVLGVIVGLLGFNLFNHANASNTPASNNNAAAVNQRNNAQNSIANNNSNNNSSNSVANGNNSNPFNGNNNRRGRGGASINQAPSGGSSSPIHTGGS